MNNAVRAEKHTAHASPVTCDAKAGHGKARQGEATREPGQGRARQGTAG